MRRVCLPGLLGIALLAGSACFGADQPTETKAKSEKGKHTANKPVAPEGTKASSESKKAAGARLPRHFGQIGLSAEQREQVKAVMDKYAGQIKELEAKINDLKAKREGELHSLLTEAQKKAIEEAKVREEKDREARKAASQKAMAARESQVRAVGEALKAKEKLVQEFQAKQKQAGEEKAKEAKEGKSKTAAKEAPKEATKTPAKESKPAEKQPEKK